MGDPIYLLLVHYYTSEPTEGKLDLPFVRAEEIIMSRKIAVSPQLGTLTITGFSDVPRVVRLYPTEGEGKSGRKRPRTNDCEVIPANPVVYIHKDAFV